MLEKLKEKYGPLFIIAIGMVFNIFILIIAFINFNNYMKIVVGGLIIGGLIILLSLLKKMNAYKKENES